MTPLCCQYRGGRQVCENVILSPAQHLRQIGVVGKFVMSFCLSRSTCVRLGWWASLWSSLGLGWQGCPLRTGPPSPTCAQSTAPPPASSLSTSRACCTCGRQVRGVFWGGGGGGLLGSFPLVSRVAVPASGGGGGLGGGSQPDSSPLIGRTCCTQVGGGGGEVSAFFPVDQRWVGDVCVVEGGRQAARLFLVSQHSLLCL